MLPEPIQTATIVVSVLDQLKIPYFLGGSFASIVHGIVRTTQDADIVADMRPEHVQPFIEKLQADFYIDEAMIRNAIQQRGSFNILHRQSIFKVDVFIPRDRPFEKSQFSRARKYPLTEGHELQAVFASAEDILLAKLEWYRLGGEVSERQWRDALGIVKIQGESIDQDYLRRWAEELSVSDLLEKLLQEA